MGVHDPGDSFSLGSYIMEAKDLRVSCRILSWGEGREQDGSRMIVVCVSVRGY